MGFDIIRFVGEVDEELLCPICTGVLQDPVQVKFIYFSSIHINNTKHFMSLLHKIVKFAFMIYHLAMFYWLFTFLGTSMRACILQRLYTWMAAKTVYMSSRQTFRQCSSVATGATNPKKSTESVCEYCSLIIPADSCNIRYSLLKKYF